MNFNEELKLLTHNGSSITAQNREFPNIYMGMGLWSATKGLSDGLPIDSMQMLLTAVISREKFLQSAPGMKSRIIIVIADSMALDEGADPGKLNATLEIYEKSIASLLSFFQLSPVSEVVRSSRLKDFQEFQKIYREVEGCQNVVRFKQRDPAHYKYILVQTAITEFMIREWKVGVKIGWLYSKSVELLHMNRFEGLTIWDELKFDVFHKLTFTETTLICIYAKAGVKGIYRGKQLQVVEGCPYTAFPDEDRFLITSPVSKRMLTKMVKRHWSDIPQLCRRLINHKIATEMLLPKERMDENNRKKTLYGLLNHWTIQQVSSGI